MTTRITMYGARWCGDCRRSKALLDTYDVDYEWVDLEAEPDRIGEVTRRNDGRRIIPTIVFEDGTHLAEPTDAELARRLGIELPTG